MNRLGTVAGALILGVAAVTATAQPVRESPAVVDVSQHRYAEVAAWCDSRFPYRDDLQEACKWGAYEMLPAREARETQETQERRV